MMKPAPHLTVLFTSLALIACAGFSGCATRGYEKAAATADAITSSSEQIDSSVRQIDDSMAALHALVDRPPTDLKAPFERFRSLAGGLEKTLEQVRLQTDLMSKQGQTYFDTWDTRLSQIHNEDIRARSAARQREVTAQFTTIQQLYQDARRELDLLMPNLRDLQAALGVDLTPAGIQSTRDFVVKTDGSAATARQALVRLSEALRTLRSTLSSSPAPVPASRT